MIVTTTNTATGGKALKVLHFYKTYYPESFGGVEQVIYQLCETLSAHGVNSQVLTLADSNLGTTRVGHHLVHRVRRDFHVASTSFSMSAVRRLAELAKEADVIHYHFPWPFMDVAHFLARIDKPTVVTYHSDIVRQKKLLQFYRPLKRHFLSRVSRIVSTSPNYLATSPVLGNFKSKTTVIPIGLNKATYPEPTPERLKYWRERLGEKFFLFVGVIRYYKGLHILLNALAGTDFPVAIVGAGPIENELREQANRLKLQNTRFLGAVPDEDKVALLSLCHGVVFPSHLRSEAFGISLLEGAMFGKPMISSEIGTGTSYINIDGETGLVVPPSDADAFRNAMQTLWDNTALAKAMGARAAVRYETLFTADRMAEAYLSLYRELVE